MLHELRRKRPSCKNTDTGMDRMVNFIKPVTKQPGDTCHPEIEGKMKKAIEGAQNQIDGLVDFDITRKIVRCNIHGEYNAYISAKVISECPACAYEEAKEQREKSLERMRENQAKARMKRIFNESSVPKIFQQVTFEHYKPVSQKSEEIKSRLETYAKKFPILLDKGACALLIGKTGTGKTMLAVAVANQVMAQGYTAMYVKCPKALMWVKRSWVKGSTISQDEQIDKFRMPDLLILDEIPKGAKGETDWETIHEIVDRRTSDLKPTISISTLPEKLLRKQIGDEVMRRLHHKGRILKFDWETYQENHLF